MVDTDVALQPMMAFSPWMIAAGFLLIAVAVVLIVLFARTFRRTDEPQPFVPTSVKIRRAKDKCLRELERIESGFDAGRIPPREAAKSASASVREFASSMTGESYESMTLSEIGRSPICGAYLAEAISECYAAEFPGAPEPTVKSAIAKCRQVVSTW